MPYIVVDAGHGGRDNGAQYFGYKEKDINLDVSKKVSKRLRALGFRVTELRTDDTDIGNAGARGKKIAQLQPDFAISIHCNVSDGTGKSSGSEVYVPLAKHVARFEYYLRDRLKQLIKFRHIWSKQSKTQDLFERHINTNTKAFTKTYYDKTDFYGIIREARKGGVNCDIIEMFYLDNEGDLHTFLNQEDAFVEAIVYALCYAFNMKYTAP